MCLLFDEEEDVRRFEAAAHEKRIENVKAHNISRTHLFNQRFARMRRIKYRAGICFLRDAMLLDTVDVVNRDAVPFAVGCDARIDDGEVRGAREDQDDADATFLRFVDGQDRQAVDGLPVRTPSMRPMKWYSSRKASSRTSVFLPRP